MYYRRHERLCLTKHNHHQHYWYYVIISPSAFLIRKVTPTLFRSFVARQGPVTITVNISTERDDAGATGSTTTQTLHKQHLRCSTRVALIEATVLSLNHRIIIPTSGACEHVSLKHSWRHHYLQIAQVRCLRKLKHEYSCTPIQINYMWFSDILNVHRISIVFKMTTNLFRTTLSCNTF